MRSMTGFFFSRFPFCSPFQGVPRYFIGAVWVCLSVCGSVFPAFGSSRCEEAARLASETTGVPLSVLRAISLTETGRSVDGQVSTWPWTINVQGKGYWFDTRLDAESFARKTLSAGVSNFDSGCFQLNYRWHGRHFKRVEDLFEPVANATYAAQFLADLHAEFGAWSKAAGAFHSRTPKYAALYRKKFDTILSTLSEPDAPMEIAAPRVNTFPLLITGARPVSLGSLVPIAESGSSRLIEFR